MKIPFSDVRKADKKQIFTVHYSRQEMCDEIEEEDEGKFFISPLSSPFLFNYTCGCPHTTIPTPPSITLLLIYQSPPSYPSPFVLGTSPLSANPTKWSNTLKQFV